MVSYLNWRLMEVTAQERNHRWACRPAKGGACCSHGANSAAAGNTSGNEALLVRIVLAASVVRALALALQARVALSLAGLRGALDLASATSSSA
jgi:hypothetical protein